MFRKALMIGAMTGALGVGVLSARAHIYVNVAPPAPVVETPGPAPGPGYMWTPGYYNYTNGNYAWINGQWVIPPAHRHHYVEGRWVHHHHDYYFREGHWRR